MKSVVIWILVVLLLILHQDYWQWDRNELVFGFLPFTLAYNIGISLATAVIWMIVCQFLWPTDLDNVSPIASNTAADQQRGSR